MPVQSPATQLNFIDVPARVLVDGDQTGGRYDVVEMISLPAGHMPPLHVHHAHDEGFYVLDGEITLFTPDAEVTLRSDEAYVAPRGIPHAYRVGEEPARVVTTSRPAGFERFVVAVDALEALDPATLAATAAEHGIEILGPPGTLP